MKILAIDTASAVCSTVLADEEQIYGEISVHKKNAASEILTDNIVHLMRSAGVTPDDLGGLAVVTGPGSFTGLRIGVSTVQGLAFGWNLPVAAVSAMESTLAAAPVTAPTVCILINARKNEFYYSRYDRFQNNWQHISGPDLISFQSLAAVLPEGEKLIMGDAVFSCRQQLEQTVRCAAFMPVPDVCSRGRGAALAGLRLFASGRTVDHLHLTPAYFNPYKGI